MLFADYESSWLDGDSSTVNCTHHFALLGKRLSLNLHQGRPKIVSRTKILEVILYRVTSQPGGMLGHTHKPIWCFKQGKWNLLNQCCRTLHVKVCKLHPCTLLVQIQQSFLLLCSHGVKQLFLAMSVATSTWGLLFFLNNFTRWIIIH